MPTMQQKNNASFEFWKNAFKPRSEKWRRETLKRLNKSQSIFESADERINKINALVSLLGL
jgi:hypothetical protein